VSSVRFVVRMGSPNGPGAHAAAASDPAPWSLLLRHQEGSIDAAVNAQKRRNTALSASILGVLGLSAGLVFFSARRLRAIAAQQVEFVAAVSHELRTPLAVIRSAADNLADGVVQDPSQSKRYGRLIGEESVRLADMVEHVLEFAGADSPARADRGSIDAAEAARAAVAGMAGLAAERGGTVSLEIEGGPLGIRGDLSHLTRAISNLLGNALKYGGAAPAVTVRVRSSAGGVEITVADQGGGLDAAEIPRLFEPFYRGRRASEARIPGSGLGLALVKRIVENHGGRVSAANHAPRGALFTILLPAA
jgi:signal transduction histidine kinase